MRDMGRQNGSPRRTPLLVPVVAWSSAILWFSIQFDLRSWFEARSLVGSTGLAPLVVFVFVPILISLLVWRGWVALGRVIDRFANKGAERDPLTGLANRTVLYDRLCAAIDESRRTGARFAVLFLDLDRFKKVNDTYGHEVGDEVIVAVSRRLREVVRAGDLLARVGGDEFVMVCQGLSCAGDAETIAERLSLALGAPFFLSGDRYFSTTASIGIAIADGHTTPATLLRESDTAMYRAKAKGRGGQATFDPRMRADLHHKAAMEGALEHALERGTSGSTIRPSSPCPTSGSRASRRYCGGATAPGASLPPSSSRFSRSRV